MSEQLKLRDYLSDDIVDAMGDELVDWFETSGLATDERTVEVVECLDTVYCSPESSIDEEALTALLAAFFHRADEVCDDIDDVDDIPGSLDDFAKNALRGFSSKKACDQHCEFTESLAPAAMLNMATRWVDGKEAYKWTFEAVDDAYRSTYAPAGATTRERGALEDLQSSFVDGGS